MSALRKLMPLACAAGMVLAATTAWATSAAAASVGPAPGTVLISDSGNQRVLALTPEGKPTTVGTGLSRPFGVAADPDADVLIGDVGSGQVVKVATDGTQTTIGNEGREPYGVAFDAAGDALITDFGGNQILRVAPDGTQTTVGKDLHVPTGVAVDAAGDVFVTEYRPARVVKVAPDGTQSVVTSDLNDPYGVTVDAAGDVIIADGDFNRVVKVSPEGKQTTIGTDLKFPTGVAVDAAGDVLITEFGGGQLTKVAPDGTQSTVLAGLSQPFGVAVVPGQSQTIDYTSTAPTHATIGDRYTVTATGGDSGNPVTFTRNATSTGHCTVTNDGENSATVNFTGHGYCAVFAHQAGNEDYAPATAPARQRIYVYKHSQTITYSSTAPTHPLVGDNYTVTATGGDSVKPVTFTRSTATAANCTVTNDGADSATVTFTATGACNIYAHQKGTAFYAAAPTVRQHIHVYPAGCRTGRPARASARDYGASRLISISTRNGWLKSRCLR